MGRLSKDIVEKLHAWVDSLPDTANKTCATCTKTLTHIVKQAEAHTGAGTATVTRVLADKINETAAPQDKVTGEALNQRVRQQEGLNDSKIRNPKNKPTAKEEHVSPEKPIPVKNSLADRFAEIAISQIKRIEKNDPRRDEAYQMIIDFCEKQIHRPSTDKPKNPPVEMIDSGAEMVGLAVSMHRNLLIEEA